MGWYGKLIGGTIGTFLMGPVGTILGTVIGHSFDKKTNSSAKDYYAGNTYGGGNNWQSTNYSSYSFDQTQMVFFVATFSMLGKMAAAGKGGYYSKEVKIIEEFIDRQLRFGPAEKQFALRIVETAANSAESFEKFAQQFYAVFRSQPQMVETVYDILNRVATVDGVCNEEEKRLLDSAATIFNLRNGERTFSYSDNASDSDKNYTTLGCKRSDSVDTIKANYKKLVKDYHPDVIASKGLPEEFTKFAAEKFSEINNAYEEIRKERNF